jgi:hypothetical protein
MVKQDDDVFDGFTLGDLSGGLISSPDEPGLPKGVGDSDIPVVDPKDLPLGDDDEPVIDDSKDDSDDDEPIKDDEPVVDDDDDDNEPDDGDDSDDEPENLGEFEADVSKFFMGKIAEELGWSLSEDEKFDSVSDVIDYMQTIVEESSQPDFASPEIEKFNEHVKNGGTLRQFYEDTISGTLDLTEFDLESEENQRAIIREDLRSKNLSEKQISRKIDRYETAGVLAEEAEDSLSSVETFREKKAQKLLVDQEKQARAFEAQQQKFFDDVQSYVKKLKDIRGVPISDIEKKKLINDIFKADATGQTQYQKVYAENFAKNLIESAFLTLKGDDVFNKVKRMEQTSAAKDLKRKLKTSKSKRTKQKDDDKDLNVSGGLDILSNQLM